MKRAYRNAFNALYKLGLGDMLYERSDIKNFAISAEAPISYKFCDYYAGHRMDDREFGVSPVITKTLAKYGLHAEWINPGELGVYEN
jgi:hypothetical protein